EALVTETEAALAAFAASDDVHVRELVAWRLDEARAHETRRRAAHDVRGALAVIAGQCEMPSGGVWGPPAPAQERALGAIRRQSARIAQVIDRWKAGVAE